MAVPAYALEWPAPQGDEDEPGEMLRRRKYPTIEREVLPVKDRITHDAIRAIAIENDRVERCKALRALGEIANGEDLDLVEKLTGDPVAEVRCEALRALKNISPDALLRTAGKALAGDASFAERRGSGEVEVRLFGAVPVSLGDRDLLLQVAAPLDEISRAVQDSVRSPLFLIVPALLLALVGRVNPWKHYKGMPQALIFGFSTCSTMVTLPLTMKAVTGNSRVSEKIAGFTLPIGATVNMDGTALYECVATIFIAQVYGFELSLGAQFIIVLTALLASIGAASVPMSGMVMMSIILKAVGLPLEGVAVILAVDRILDMFRTTVNILSDSCGAVIVARLEGESLKGMGEPVPD